MSLSAVQLFATPWTVALQAHSVHGILQARILQWVVIPFSRGSSQSRDIEASNLHSEGVILPQVYFIWATVISNYFV